MIIENARAGMLSNFEVLRLLEEQQEKQKAAQDNPNGIGVPENLRTVQFELTDYLKGTPSSTQDEQQVKDFVEAMNSYELTLAEKLQLLNLRPKSAVEIYLLIEECEERFSEDQLEEMLQTVLSVLPRDDDYEMEEGYEEEEGGEEDQA
ncbi:RNA polymerase Rpb4-domain-containing protein [Zychaea mexicana]|uniref:RNA polymerase Rpb4-domain-containing protein n=1 Tax=Zychaea mexicana TaxID=64656 RepID=UPI0022FDDB04|nr:RNA polymerase Rpb4-domain-containing protein [Zychaea mexicana]KAI9494892.1 RNA polymerase Rpb4-domain-containing protein [Zychaea mexicana]